MVSVGATALGAQPSNRQVREDVASHIKNNKDEDWTETADGNDVTHRTIRRFHSLLSCKLSFATGTIKSVFETGPIHTNAYSNNIHDHLMEYLIVDISTHMIDLIISSDSSQLMLMLLD